MILPADSCFFSSAFNKYATGTKPIDYMALVNGELDNKTNPSPTYFLAYMVIPESSGLFKAGFRSLQEQYKSSV